MIHFEIWKNIEIGLLNWQSTCEFYLRNVKNIEYN